MFDYSPWIPFTVRSSIPFATINRQAGASSKEGIRKEIRVRHAIMHHCSPTIQFARPERAFTRG